MIKIFIQNAITFDFAFFGAQGVPMGKSFYIDVSFEGSINQKGMIIDFSKAKKIIKLAISQIDHKLVVSHSHIKYKTKSHIIVLDSSIFSTSSKNVPKIKKHYFAMHAPTHWIKILPSRILKGLQKNELKEMEKFIEKIILKHAPKNIEKISIKLNEKQPKVSQCNFNRFHYTHTLCRHSGNCQRFHGHSAEVQIFKNGKLDSDLSYDSAQKINGLYIASEHYLRPLHNSKRLQKIKKYCFDENLYEKITHDLVAFEYKGSQGSTAMIISKALSIILPNESTVENIAAFIHAQIAKKQEIEVRVYEGLDKGASIL